MKIVRINPFINNIVEEILSPSLLPLEKYFSEDFINMCLEAPDYVEQRWYYLPETQEWVEHLPEQEQSE